MRTVKQVQRAKDSPWEEFLRAHFKRENPSETGNKKHQCFPIIVAARPMLHKELSIPTKKYVSRLVCRCRCFEAKNIPIFLKPFHFLPDLGADACEALR